MVSLPDFEREFSAPPLCSGGSPDVPAQAADRDIVRMGLRLAAAGLIAAAFGLWIMPPGAADPVLMLIKMLFSIILFGAGVLGLHAARRPDRHTGVQIDRKARELRVVTADSDGSHDVVIHRFDDLQELSLRDGLLSARNRSGDLVVSLDIAGGRGERAMRKALADAL